MNPDGTLTAPLLLLKVPYRSLQSIALARVSVEHPFIQLKYRFDYISQGGHGRRQATSSSVLYLFKVSLFVSALLCTLNKIGIVDGTYKLRGSDV